MSIYEIVPNFSEGCDASVIDALVETAHSVGARVLHRTSDVDHHRSVLTIAGSAHEVLEAAVALAGVAQARIDLRTHRGVHPRIGALDVLPFVPLHDGSMAEAIHLAHRAGRQIWERYQIPSFYYGAAARSPDRTQLARVRAGGFEGLDARFADSAWAPDEGTVAKHPTAGAIAIGARNVLVALNVELATGDLAIARDIARVIRERDGGLGTLRALGFRLHGERVQVSLNVTDYRATPLYRVVELIARLAYQRGVRIARTELIGLLPADAMVDVAHYYLGTVPTGPKESSNHS